MSTRDLFYFVEPCTAGDHDINVTTCGFAYSSNHEERGSHYCNHWRPCAPGQSPLYPEHWRFRHHGETGSYPTTARLATYAGGGYVVELGRSKAETRSSMLYLFKNSWLDEYTRAVFIDLTAYNNNANFYVMMLMLLEVPATGGAVVTTRILTTRLDRYSSGFSIFLGVCEISFLMFTLYYMYRELKKLKRLKWKYFMDWQNWIEFIGFILIWTSFGLLIIRLGIVTVVKNKYFADSSKFINFENAALSDMAYGHVLAFVAVVVFVKFLKLLRFNNKMLLMFKTVQYASKDLKYFTISFALVFLAFAQLSYLLFSQHIEGYSNFIRTIESLFNLMLGKFDFYAIISANKTLGPMFFMSFVFVMVYILINMFISIIIESFASVQDMMRYQRNQYELIHFLKLRFKGFLPASLTRKSDNSTVKTGIELNIPGRKEVKLKLDRKCSKVNLQEKNPLDGLERAVDRLSEYVSEMLRDDEFELKVLEILLKMKKDVPG